MLLFHDQMEETESGACMQGVRLVSGISWAGMIVVMAIVVAGCAPRYVYQRAADGVVFDDVARLSQGGAEYPLVEGYVTVADTGVQLWYRRSGPIDAPPVILINGSDFASHWWHPEFLEALLEAGFQVIQYDQRDCGRSEYLPFPKDFKPGKYRIGDSPPYPLTALRDDLDGLMTALDIGRAHIIGVSLGGMVAQLLAIENPERAHTLTLLSTSPSNTFDQDLDNPGEEFLTEMGGYMMKAGMAYYTSSSDRWMGPLVEGIQLITNASDGGEDFRKFLQENEEFGGFNFMSGQGFAIASSPSRIPELPGISAPTLILHGTEDPWFRYSHAERLAELIPSAELIAVEGEGHAMPRDIYNPYVSRVVSHLKAAMEEPVVEVPELSLGEPMDESGETPENTSAEPRIEDE